MEANRIANFRKYKILDLQRKATNSLDPVSKLYFIKLQQLEKLRAEAVEIRDFYNDIIKSEFGVTFATTTTTNPLLGAPRKAAEDWIRLETPLDHRSFDQ